MKIATLKEALMLATQSRVTPFIWGHRGIGKSSVVRQICAENKLGFIDLRCSQLEAADIRGLPDKDEKGCTVYRPPADLPRLDNTITYDQLVKRYSEAPDESKEHVFNSLQPFINKGVLFLDEINRGQNDVLQAVFELILDRKVGQYTLPQGWSVIAAGNFMEGDYQVNGFLDSAFLDRFCHMVLSDGESTLDEWAQFMVDKHGSSAASVIEFASHNIKHLDGAVTGDLGFSVQPSRRSWEAVVRVEKACSEHGFSEEARIEVCSGLVGRDLALSYTRYNCPVKWKEVVDKGVKELKTKLEKLNRNQLIGLMWGLAAGVKDRIDEEKISNVALDFAEWMCGSDNREKDLVIAFCRSLIDDKKKSSGIEQVAIVNRNVAKLIADVRKNSEKKGFVAQLYSRPKLHALVSKTSWGTDEEDDKKKK